MPLGRMCCPRTIAVVVTAAVCVFGMSSCLGEAEQPPRVVQPTDISSVDEGTANQLSSMAPLSRGLDLFSPDGTQRIRLDGRSASGQKTAPVFIVGAVRVGANDFSKEKLFYGAFGAVGRDGTMSELWPLPVEPHVPPVRFGTGFAGLTGKGIAVTRNKARPGILVEAEGLQPIAAAGSVDRSHAAFAAAGPLEQSTVVAIGPDDATIAKAEVPGTVIGLAACGQDKGTWIVTVPSTSGHPALIGTTGTVTATNDPAEGKEAPTEDSAYFARGEMVSVYRMDKSGQVTTLHPIHVDSEIVAAGIECTTGKVGIVTEDSYRIVAHYGGSDADSTAQPQVKKQKLSLALPAQRPVTRTEGPFFVTAATDGGWYALNTTGEDPTPMTGRVQMPAGAVPDSLTIDNDGRTVILASHGSEPTAVTLSAFSARGLSCLPHSLSLTVGSLPEGDHQGAGRIVLMAAFRGPGSPSLCR